jgi:oxygen-dependent protoporphyrinogen oxidase
MQARVVIVGGGITGLATAAWLEHDHGIDDYVILEAASRAGGKIRSEVDSGFTLEWGPQGFLDNSPDTLALSTLLELDDDLVRADERSADRFILRRGRLRKVVTSPPAFMLSSVLPLSARLRLLAEPFAQPHPGSDETVFEFASRRIGRQAAEILVDAMVTGVFAGDSRKLSLAATFPKMAAMESEHGSLTRALLAKMREARKSGTRSAGPAGPGGTLTTFDGGMVRLTRRLAERAGGRLSLKRTLQVLERDGSIFRLETEQGVIETDTVLLTLPAERAALLLTGLAPDAVRPLSEIPTAPIAVVMLAYSDQHAFGPPIRGFGFLVPRGEDDALLGTLYCHDIFPVQAPPDSLFLRAMVGGARSPDSVGLDDDHLLDQVRASLARVYGADPDPDMVWLVRWEQGISQYTVGHLDRVAAAEGATQKVGIELAGSPYRGVSVNDCVKQARVAANRLAERIRR